MLFFSKAQRLDRHGRFARWNDSTGKWKILMIFDTRLRFVLNTVRPSLLDLGMSIMRGHLWVFRSSKGSRVLEMGKWYLQSDGRAQWTGRVDVIEARPRPRFDHHHPTFPPYSSSFIFLFFIFLFVFYSSESLKSSPYNHRTSRR